MSITPLETATTSNQYQIDSLLQGLLRDALEAQQVAQNLVAQVQAARAGEPSTLGAYEIAKLQSLADSLKDQQVELKSEFKMQRVLGRLAKADAPAETN
jgi:hypothetical protein